MKIAVVQQNHSAGRVEENLSKALSFAKNALSKGAEIILFHEELLAGYTNNTRELSQELDGPETKAFSALLSGTDAKIIVGLTEKCGDRYYISASVVTKDGVIANYRKLHLWWNDVGPRDERIVFTPGEGLVCFEHKGVKCGLMICYDGDFPEMTRCYANLGCGLLFWLNNRGSRGHEEVKALAENNSMIMAASCCCGKNERGGTCRGGSNVTNHDGSLITEIWDNAGVIYADVDPAAALEARKANPWYTGRRPDLYCRYA